MLCIDKIFVDSNIWLYLLLQDNDRKYKLVEDFFIKNKINSTYIITYQIINEVSNILLKNDYAETKIKENIEICLKYVRYKILPRI
jgi:predicted nucleic acid-binding protein